MGKDVIFLYLFLRNPLGQKEKTQSLIRARELAEVSRDDWKMNPLPGVDTIALLAYVSLFR